MAKNFEKFKNKKVLIVGIGRTGFALIQFFNQLNCEIRVTDIRPIFDLNKAVKKLRKISPAPEMTFGEHKDEDFIDADIVVFSSEVNPDLSQLRLARNYGKMVFNEFELAYIFASRPIIAICGTHGRSTVAHMIGHTLKLDGKKVFVGGSSENPFINLWLRFPDEDVDYIVVEISVLQMQCFENFKPHAIVFTDIVPSLSDKRFRTHHEYIETKIKLLRNMRDDVFIVANFDKLYHTPYLKELTRPIYWFTRKSFLNITEAEQHELVGTHFHQKRIHCNIHSHSEFKVNVMKIVGSENRENLLAAITTCKALKISDKSIQTSIEMFPGIPHRLEFVMEKNGIRFYNDSKSELIEMMMRSLYAFKTPVILIAGGKDLEQNFDKAMESIRDRVRVMVLVGESKEVLNRVLGNATQTYLVGSFEESVLLAYQKSRTGDVILLSPGCPSSDIFRDFEERGNYYKKLVYQL